MKKYYIYEIVDEETGELIKAKSPKLKNYKTIKNEKSESIENNCRVIRTTRIVRHNRQQELFEQF
jgi:hypothetical protein